MSEAITLVYYGDRLALYQDGQLIGDTDDACIYWALSLLGYQVEVVNVDSRNLPCHTDSCGIKPLPSALPDLRNYLADAERRRRRKRIDELTDELRRLEIIDAKERYEYDSTV